jgi:hypothetical protein
MGSFDNQKSRLQFAKKFILESKAYWRKVLWSDETKINLYSSDGRTWAWRRDGEAYDDRVTTKTVKYNGGGISLWGCIGWNRVGRLAEIEGLMDAPKYISILQENLEPSN